MIGITLPFSSKEEARHLRVCNVNISLIKSRCASEAVSDFGFLRAREQIYKRYTGINNKRREKTGCMYK